MQKPVLLLTSLLMAISMIPVASAYLLVDEFSDTTINNTMWNFTGTANVSQKNGYLWQDNATDEVTLYSHHMILNTTYDFRPKNYTIEWHVQIANAAKAQFGITNLTDFTPGDADYVIFLIEDNKFKAIYNGIQKGAGSVPMSGSPLEGYAKMVFQNHTRITTYYRFNESMDWTYQTHFDIATPRIKLSYQFYKLGVAWDYVRIYETQTEFNIYNHITGVAITDNITVDVICDSLSGTYYTTTGSITFPGATTPELPSDTCLLRFSGSGYNETTRYITAQAEEVSYDVYMIETVYSDYTDVTVYDENGDTVAGALVKLMRYDVDDNTYDTIDEKYVDQNGQERFYLQYGTEFYKWTVVYLGETQLITGGAYVHTTTTSLRISRFTAELDNFYTVMGVDYTLFYNTTSGNMHFTYNDASSTTGSACLYLYYFLETGKTLLNQSCPYGSSGTALIPIYSTNNTFYRAEAYINLSDDYYLLAIKDISFAGDIDYGNDGLAYLVISVLVMAGIGLWNPAVAIIGTSIPFFLLSFFGMIPKTFIGVGMGLLVTGIVIIVIMRRKT